MRSSLACVVFIVVAVCGAALNLASAEQFRGERTSDSQVVGIVLNAPDLRPNETLTEAKVRADVEEKTKELEKSIRVESVAGSPANAEIVREAIIDSIPVGYGSVVSTRDIRDPGPEADGSDPRVIDFSDQPVIERRVGNPNFLPVAFLERGASSARAVARVAYKYQDLPTAGLGTGFMISRSLFITNHHVIGDSQFASKLELHFNYQYALDGLTIGPPVVYQLDPSGFFLTNAALDFTIVKVKPRDVTEAGGNRSTREAGDEFGAIALRESYFYSKGQLAHVIQHPLGRPKEIALHENEIQAIYKDVIRYKTDTEPGSSGSPVFNNSWTVVALHHSAGEQDEKTKDWLNNEGIRIDRIIEYLRARDPKALPPAIRTELGL